jgi:hypothetical protein
MLYHIRLVQDSSGYVRLYQFIAFYVMLVQVSIC